MLGPRTRSLPVLLALVVAGLALAPSPAHAAEDFVVTTTADVVDGGDGEMSLREAFAAADAASGGDGIILEDDATYTLTRCGAESGDVDNLQGDLDLAGSGDLILHGNDATIVQTCSDEAGVDDGIMSFDSGGIAELSQVTLRGGGGAGIAAFDRPILLEWVTVEQVQGAALRLVAADLTLRDSTIASSIAGVVSLDPAESSVTATVERSTVRWNGTETTAVGGLLVEGDLTLQQSTVAGNLGAIGGIDADYLNADRSTIAGNEGDDVDEVAVDQLVASGAIVGEGEGASPDCAIGEVVFSAFTLYGDADCQDGAIPPDIPPTDDLVGVDPELRPLADNGGPTFTRLPRFSSPVIDAISPTLVCTGADQRGVTRPQGASCDIGSVERGLSFTDVGWGHQFVTEIECLVDLEVTEGFDDGTFRPTDSISRQGVVAWLWRLAGEPDPVGPSPFSDVPASHQFHDAIVWAAEEDVATGFSDGTFRPGSPVARQGVAAWLWRLAGEPDPGDTPGFSDVPVGSLFEEPIGWLADAGVTEGFPDGTFRPTSPIARQGLAAWICRYDALPT
jgi:hypothetical protein